MADPLVSVIIPAYNRERYLSQAIESVLAQSYRPIEIIVVDDGSTDNTAQTIIKYDNVRYLWQQNQGVASARNKGISAACGEIIAFLDSDDVWPQDRLTLAVRHLHKFPESGYVLGKQIMFVEPGAVAPPWVKPEWLAVPQDASNTGVLVVRKETFDRVGLFNTEYSESEDTEWLVRAKEKGVRMSRIQEVFVLARIHEENLSNKMMHRRKATLIRIARESICRHQK